MACKTFDLDNTKHVEENIDLEDPAENDIVKQGEAGKEFY